MVLHLRVIAIVKKEYVLLELLMYKTGTSKIQILNFTLFHIVTNSQSIFFMRTIY